jgi:hypothetical protein
MSFARFGPESDVYVYAHVGGFVQCCGCLLGDFLGDDWDYHSAADVVAHMQEHVDAGHRVPQHLLSPDTYDDDDFIEQSK